METNPKALDGVVRKAFALAKAMRKRSHAPYSKFRVGAALIGPKGRLIGGCNVENASYGGTVCAERVAILRAVAEGAGKIEGVVVVTDAKKPAFPCALCLQVMAEFLKPSTPIFVADTKAIRYRATFEELLPHRFGPSELAEGN